MKEKHTELQRTAINWLYSRNCSIFANEVPTENGIADALGMKNNGDTYYIECKASRSDLICPKQQRVYKLSTGATLQKCMFHSFTMNGEVMNTDWQSCGKCKFLEDNKYDTGIDFYYVMVANGITVEPTLYQSWGVLDENGIVLRKAKRMTKNPEKVKATSIAIAHVLVYKVFGKMYLSLN